MARKKDKVIVTVLGEDKTGIVAKVSTALSKLGANIEDLSSTKMQDMFAMLILADISNSKHSFKKISSELKKSGEKAGLQILVQHEDVFKFMHRV